jgi:dienelactone hydrolase
MRSISRRQLTFATTAAWIAGMASAARSEAVDQPITFSGAGGAPLAGSLVLAGGGKTPAVVLVQGSGPTDRDGNQLPRLRTDLLVQLARLLAENGIASLRYDKRGIGGSAAGLPHDRESLSRFAAWENFVADGEAAFQALASQPSVDTTRIGVIGHSEGGLIALSLASRAVVHPKALVLLATPGRPLGQVLDDQIGAALDRQKAPPAVRTFFLDAKRRIEAAIAETGTVPADVPPGLQAIYPGYLGPFLRSLLALDPAALAKDYSGPILAIDGTADTQVFAARDAAVFQRVLAGRSDGSAVVMPDAVSHNMKHAAPGEDGFGGPLDDAVRGTLQPWLAAHL